MSLRSILRPIRMVGALPARLIRRRRELLELLGADDRVLSDMGLSRRDVVSALSWSFWREEGFGGRGRGAKRRAPDV